MSRYLGPRLRKLRQLDSELPGLTGKSRERRPQRPGQHGHARRRKPSEFSVRLNEKQKLRYNYGVTESQLRRVVGEAKRSKDPTGDKILELLERRLDNVVFRAGFAPSIPAARQLVNHGHFLVNGKKVDIASFRVKAGDVVTLRERSRKVLFILNQLESPTLALPGWLELDKGNFSAKVQSLPDFDSVPLLIVPQWVIEYYAR